MPLKCKQCGTRFGYRHILEITNDPNGYYCNSCHTIHSWVDGSVTLVRPRVYNVRLGGKGVKKK